MSKETFPPGKLVHVIQTVRTRTGPWNVEIVGEVVRQDWQPTGSWFTHGKNDKLWLNRMRLRKSDGELVDIVVDENTRIISGNASSP